MFGSVFLRFSELERPFVLLVALAVMLLVSVSVTVAHAASTVRLAHGIERDLGALRVQLEQVDPWQADLGRRSAAFNADLGDGSPAFRRLSLTTIVRAANRRLERLIESYRQDGDDRRVRTAEALRLAMYDLQHEIDRLARTADPASAAVIEKKVGALLDRSERGLDVLLNGPDGPPLLSGAEPPSPAAGAEEVVQSQPLLILRGGTAAR